MSMIDFSEIIHFQARISYPTKQFAGRTVDRAALGLLTTDAPQPAECFQQIAVCVLDSSICSLLWFQGCLVHFSPEDT